MAVKAVTKPLKAKTRIKAGPATPAAMPVNTKIPAPIMAPTPIMVTWSRPISRANSVTGAPSFFTAIVKKTPF